MITSTPRENNENCLVGKPDPFGPFSAKGVSEAGLVQTALAISNAIFNACGRGIRSFPVRRLCHLKEPI